MGREMAPRHGPVGLGGVPGASQALGLCYRSPDLVLMVLCAFCLPAIRERGWERVKEGAGVRMKANTATQRLA